MSFRVVIEEEAEQELVEAVTFYEHRQPGLGQRFGRELRAFFNIVGQNPERFPPASRLTRRARMPRPWPYSVFFATKPESSEVVITAIWHGSRNPAELRRRLK